MAREILIRGILEGFYGPPWTHRERLDMLSFCGRHGLNTFLYAPKDDPYHRESWREPYPAADLDRLAELVAEGRTHGVDFIWSIAPGLSVRYSDDAELAALVAKAEQVRGIGVHAVHLLYDDIPEELVHAADVERFGDAASAQSHLANRFLHELGGPLVVCPVEYAGTQMSPYRSGLAEQLDPEIGVYWTGPEVVSTSITRADSVAARAAFGGRELWLWDNYPVNDFERSRLFLGPLEHRAPDLAIDAYVAAAMIQAGASKLPLATTADYARDPAGYDPEESFKRGISELGGPVADSLLVFANATRGMAVDGVQAAASSIVADLPDTFFVDSARPWLDAADGKPRYERIDPAPRILPEPPPGVAWDGLVERGWAESEGHVFLDDALRIVEPEHPLAAGLHDVVRVYRGPAWMRYAHPGPDAVVIARDLKRGRPVLFAYEAPRRVGFFLGPDASLTPEGRMLLDTAAHWAAG